MTTVTDLVWIVEADGGSRGNPGLAGYGAVVRDPETGDVLLERKGFVGDYATCNEAEYRGLIAGLEAALELGATKVAVRMDSRLVVEQMSGKWQVRSDSLLPLFEHAAELAQALDHITFTWVPRIQNKAADTLANAAMDEARYEKTQSRKGSR
jgi:probable phosphoglycerate mutase